MGRRDVVSMVAAGMQRDGGVTMGAARRYGRPIESCFASVAIATHYPVPARIGQSAIVIDIRDGGNLHDKPTPNEVLEEALALRPEMQACAKQIAATLIANKRKVTLSVSDESDRRYLPIFSIVNATSGVQNETTLPQMMGQYGLALDKDRTLLTHIRDLHQKCGTAHLSTSSIIEHLAEMQYEVRNGTGAQAPQRGLAERLLHFGLRPVRIRSEHGVQMRGYRSEQLTDAFRRYLKEPSENPKSAGATVTSEV